MYSELSPLRGMKDIYNNDYEIFKLIENKARILSKLYGYTGMQTPILEHISVFNRSLGETSDVISKEIYSFNDKKNRHIALRPEFTAGIMRAFYSNGLKQNLPVKFFSCGPLFRYDRPQEGRQRQFHQLNFENIGKRSPFIDAEMVMMAVHLLEELGIYSDVTLELNSLGCDLTRERYQKSLVDYFNQHKEQLSEESKARLIKNPIRILDSKDKSDQQLVKEAPLVSEYYTEEAAEYFDKTLKALNELQVKYVINERLVRGLDYYSDIIFEFTTTKLGAQSTVLAGGRYDKLAKLMGKEIMPAIGFAAGIERIMLMQKDQPAIKLPVCIMPLEQNANLPALKLATYLREHKVAVTIDSDGKLGKRLSNAVNNNYVYVIIMGEDEIKNNMFKLKNLTTKYEQLVSKVELIKILKTA